MKETENKTYIGHVQPTAQRTSAGARPVGTHPVSTRPAGTRPAAARPAGTRPAAARPAGTRPAGTRPAGTRPVGSTGAKRPTAARPSAQTKKKKSGIGASVAAFFDDMLNINSASSQSRQKHGPDWQMILALVVIVIILIGIIALCIIGLSNCSDGCSSSTVTTGNAKIHPIATDTPEPTSVPSAVETQLWVEQTPSPQTTVEPIAYAQPYQAPDGLRSATIRNIGDFVIHTEVFDSASKLAKSTGTEYPYNFAPMLNYIRESMESADFTVANVDGPMGGKEYFKYKRYNGYPQFNTPPYLLYALVDAGVDMLTLANNHMLDTYYDGLIATINNVEQVGLKHVGANRSKEEKDAPVIYEVNGIKIGFMNYTVSLNEMDKVKGLNPNAMKFAVNATKNSDPSAYVRTLKNAGADVIVCYMHWGTEYEGINSSQQNLANILVNAGVDVIVGGHPHVVQPAKYVTGTNQFGEEQRTLVMYSMGNFLSFQRAAGRDGGVIFDFTIQEQPDGSFEIVNPCYMPIWDWVMGTESTGYTFYVLPASRSIQNRPSGMSDADFNRMKEFYAETISTMNTGVGACIDR